MRLLFFCFFTFVNLTFAKAQCPGNFTITSISKPSSAQATDGELVVEVTGSSSFTSKLYSYVNAEKKLVEQKNGIGNTALRFKNLDGNLLYRMSITFSNEKDPLCSTRLIDNIDLTGKRK